MVAKGHGETVDILWGFAVEYGPLRSWVVSSVEERFPDTEEVTGSNPVPPTIK